MKLAIHSRNAALCSTRRLEEAIVAAGHEAMIVDDLRCDRNIASHRPQVIDGGEPLEVSARRRRSPGRPSCDSSRFRGQRSTAVRSAKAMGLRACGVDMPRSNHGPVVMEVHSAPGLEGIEASMGLDVAGKVIACIEAHAGQEKNRDRIKG